MKQKCSSIITIMRCGLKAKMIMLLIATITIFGTGLVYADSSTKDITINVTFRDIWPPAPITNLSALAGSQEGEVLLNWTAPYEDDEFSSGKVEGYYIVYDTFSISDLGGDTTAWWDAAGGWRQITFANDPGQLEIEIIPNLPPGTILYFAIKSYDDGGNESEIDIRAATPGQQAWARVTAIPPAAVTNLVAETWTGEGEIRLTWTAPGDDGSTGNIDGGKYGIKYATYTTFDFNGPSSFDIEWSTNTTLGASEAKVVTGLTPGTTYYFRIWTRDEVPTNWSGLSNGATAWAQIVILAPEPPTGLVAKPGNRRVTLTWTANEEEDMSRYWVYRSTTSESYDYSVAIATVTHPTTEYVKYVDRELTNEVTYYYKLKAVNKANYASEPSYEVWARPSLRPREPCGVKGTLVDGGEHIKIQWKTVTRNEDGSPCTDLEEYRIYRSTSLVRFDVEPSSTVTQSILTWNETEDITNKTYYYKVRAVDSNGVESGDSMIIMVQDGKINVIAVAEDIQAKVLIPEELTDILYEESNSYGDDLNIKVEEVEEVESCYEFSAFRGYGNEILEEIESFSFAKPKASVSLSYEVGSSGLVKGTSIKASQAGRNLALFWFNGIEWVKLGARTDTDKQVLWIRTKKLGKYKIKEAFAATEFTLNKVYPRIFTPNNDGLNDVVNFEYANPNEKGVVCRIFDIRGALVRQLDIGQTETSFTWDGKDEKGKVVPSGVYIYQLEGEGKVINGTVILAK